MTYNTSNLPQGCVKNQKLHNPWNHGSRAVMPEELTGFTHVKVSECDALVPVEELELHSNQITYKGGLGYRVEHPVLDGMTWGTITHLVEMS